MLRFYYNPAYKYTNRTIIDVSSDTSFREIDYENIDSPDTINGHIIYQLEPAERIPTYVVDSESGWRWFVSGITQLRTGKFQISLLRDIVSESPNTWSSEQAYIEAGTASDFCKYKKWGLPFTNTKIGSQRLNFGGKSSFFVYYVNERKENSGNYSEDDFSLTYTTLPGMLSYDIDLNDLNEVPFFNYVDAGPIRSWENLKGNLRLSVDGNIWAGSQTNYLINIDYDNVNNSSNDYYINKAITSVPSSPYTSIDKTLKVKTYNDNTITAYLNNWEAPNANGRVSDTSTALNTFLTSYRSSLGSAVSQTSINTLDAYVNQIIRIPNALDPSQYDFYRINMERTVTPHNDLLTNAQTTSLTTLLGTNGYIGTSFENVGTGHLYFQSTENTTTYTLEFIGTATTFTYNFKANTRKLPKSAVRCVNIVADPDNNITDQLIMQTLMLCQANPNVDETQNIGRIIDVQYLPFSVATEQSADFTIGATQLIAEFIDNDDFIYQTNLPSRTNINKETDSIYIVSPSRKSQFKFSPYNNDGLMQFSTKITIRPNQSIIYVRPTTKGLLLQDWDDKECLVIQEDFSLTTINSAWTSYVYNNRNFQNAFNLQVQTKEFERSWERRIEQEQAKSDEWNARNLSAQKAQTYTGNLPIISSISSAIGTSVTDEKYMAAAALDREYNEALYQKSMEVARQQFSYQIDNVKSQPLIPATITAIDCKMLDGIYLEFYSTNSTELNSIALYYQYNGNRIDNYGTFASYWGNFVRGKIIISFNYTQPEIDELNRRLELGIYTGGLTL